MAEYIEREVLKDNFHSTKRGILYYNGKAYMDLDVIDEIVSNVSAADVVEIRQGYWKGKPISGYARVVCSACGTIFTENPGRWNYCPNCGAKMDKVVADREAEKGGSE